MFTEFTYLVFAVTLLFGVCNKKEKPTEKKSEKVEYIAAVSYEGLFNLFPKDIKNQKGKPSSAELSGAVFVNNQIILVNDKAIPGYSPVITMPYQVPLPENEMEYYVAKPFIESHKFEDITITPQQNYLLAITSFDRVGETEDLVGFNNLLYWTPEKPDDVKYINDTKTKAQNSLSLRPHLSKLLANKQFPDGVPYFKIEGLMVLPDNKLVFGIRESGATYESFNYQITMIAVSYQIHNQTIQLSNDYAIAYDWKPKDDDDIVRPLGLSSIEYDQFNNRIYLLTSFEINKKDTQIGAYLWILSMENYKQGKSPVLVRKKNGDPLRFSHKAEGIAIVDKSTVFIIYDDDKILELGKKEKGKITERDINENVYSVVTFKK